MSNLTRCPDCGRSVSRDAASCPSCGRRIAKAGGKSVGCCGLIVAGFFALCLFSFILSVNKQPGSPSPVAPSPSPPSPPRPKIGDRVVLALPGGKVLWLAADDDSFDEMLDAENAQSIDLMARLMEQGRVAQVNNGTPALVVKTATFSTFVRVEGGLYKGFEGWTQFENVHPMAEPAKPKGR